MLPDEHGEQDDDEHHQHYDAPYGHGLLLTILGLLQLDHALLRVLYRMLLHTYTRTYIHSFMHTYMDNSQVRTRQRHTLFISIQSTVHATLLYVYICM